MKRYLATRWGPLEACVPIESSGIFTCVRIANRLEWVKTTSLHTTKLSARLALKVELNVERIKLERALVQVLQELANLEASIPTTQNESLPCVLQVPIA